MTVSTFSRWLFPAALAAGLASLAIAAPARANDDLVRVIVDVADVVLRGDSAYYRNGHDGRDDRLTVSRDRYGRPVYYRTAPRYSNVRRHAQPRYAPAYVSRDRHVRGRNQTRCDRYGRCTTRYSDPRQDRARRGDWHR